MDLETEFSMLAEFVQPLPPTRLPSGVGSGGGLVLFGSDKQGSGTSKNIQCRTLKLG